MKFARKISTYLQNEWLSDADRELFEEMKLHEPQRYKVAGLGQWGVAAGQYFSEFDESRHAVKPFEIPAGWTKFRSMDFGQAKPYCVLWFAVDFDGNMWCYRELYGWGGKANVGTGETAKQIAEKIAQIETPAENVRSGVLDSACWARTGVTAPSIAEELNRVLASHGLSTFGKSSKGRLEGANLFKQRLIGNKLKDGTLKPAIYFFASCIHCLRTIPMIGYDKRKPELPDTDSENHAYDAVAYAVSSRPWTPNKANPARKVDGYRKETKSSIWAI